MTDPAALREEILRLTREYSRQVHAGFRPAADRERTPWQEGTNIPYAGRVFTEDEVEAAVSSTLDFWLTLGKEGDAFQQELAAFLGVRHSLLVNSGSSANLIAISALTSPKLPVARRLKPGDEVITVAAGFPTTVAPIVQVGAVPVFIDADPITGNARCDQLEAAYSAGKTKAVRWPPWSIPSIGGHLGLLPELQPLARGGQLRCSRVQLLNAAAAGREPGLQREQPWPR